MFITAHTGTINGTEVEVREWKYEDDYILHLYADGKHTGNTYRVTEAGRQDAIDTLLGR
jgi:hypothetical protein